MTIRDTEGEVIEDILARKALGYRKYGLSVAENPLAFRQWLNHAYEECLDQAIYLKRGMQEFDSTEPPK